MLHNTKTIEHNKTLLIIKTQDACYDALEALITKLHDYDTPQIVQLPIEAGALPYLSWLNDMTQAG